MKLFIKDQFWLMLIVIGIILLIYGVVSIIFSVSFFWESIWISLFFIFGGIVKYLKTKTQNKIIIYGSKVFFSLFVLGQIMFLTIIPYTNSYDEAINNIYDDDSLVESVGGIEKINLIPFGYIKILKKDNISKGSASFYFIIKGKKKHKIINKSVVKLANIDYWEPLNNDY